MKNRNNETIDKAYTVLVNERMYRAKLTPCAMSENYNSIVIENRDKQIVYTDIKRDYFTIYELISTWAVKTFHNVKRLTVVEA